MSWLKRMNEEEQDLGRMVQHAAELHGVSNKKVVDTLLDEEEKYEGRGGRRWGLWVMFVVVGVVFGVAVVWFMKFVNGPAASGPSVATQINEA